ncbi:universal stress protein UspA [Microvirga ossetica]|uniref:Universal stress protein UspA n=1 Tax=Microvirga ossetica TaxID=1882682 RepID=A0A1B2EPP1_9HYPH|nr:universal stress protein [Microvirga ossetica]ANY81782.1 universal stress protein UspA [Microvirga ossetica]
MVVIDQTPECARAVHFASRRAARTGASMVMLAVVDPPDNFEWIGVGEAMIEEATEEAQKRLEDAAREARSAAGVEPEQAIRVGNRADEIIKLINEDEDISFFVLAAGSGKEGPGPLVSSLAGKAAASFPVPIVIVPGTLTDEEIDALAG